MGGIAAESFAQAETDGQVDRVHEDRSAVGAGGDPGQTLPGPRRGWAQNAEPQHSTYWWPGP
jgi:hypothetical protein